jgi:AsmA protein
MKGGTTSLGKELPFKLEFKDGRAQLSKPIRIARPDAEVSLSGGFRLDGTLDMPATVALSPLTVASLTGGRVRPSAPVPVSFRLSGPAWSPTLSEMDLRPAVSAILKEAGSAALGKALGVPGASPGGKALDVQKKAGDEVKKRLEGLFGR